MKERGLKMIATVLVLLLVLGVAGVGVFIGSRNAAAIAGLVGMGLVVYIWVS